MLCVALARGPGGVSLSETAAWDTTLELAEISDSCSKRRPAPTLLC